MRKTLVAAVAIMTAVIGIVTPASASPAEPSSPTGAQVQGGMAPMAGPYRMKHRASGLCLMAYHGYNQPLAMRPCTSESRLYWYWNQQPDGWWEIRNMATNTCLEGNTSDQAFGGQCAYRSTQKWQRHADGHIGIRGMLRVLDSNAPNGERVYLHAWNDGEYQKWDLLIV